jgi:hypothetical protein
LYSLRRCDAAVFPVRVLWGYDGVNYGNNRGNQRSALSARRKSQRIEGRIVKAFVTTESGSVYKVNTDAGTWDRIQETDESGPLRTDGGELTNVYDMEIGKRMILFGPPIVPMTSGRIIMTTPVVRITVEASLAVDG